MVDEELLNFHRVFGQIIRAHFYLMQDELDKEGLYPGQPQLLFVLYKKPGSSQKEIADILKVKPATVNVMVKRLEKGNFLYKKVDEKDARVSKVYLTDKGTMACNKVKHLIKDVNEICLHDFSEEEISSLNFLLGKVKHNLEIYEKKKKE